jgi:hypothetical protein
MTTWGSNGAAASGVSKSGIVANVKRSTNQNLYVNTTPGAIISNLVIGIYGVTPAEVAIEHTRHQNQTVTPGWVLRRSGMGPVLKINITAGGSGYSNLDLAKVTGGTVNTSATVTTNSTGGIISFGSPSGTGGLFTNSASATLAISNTTGGTANGTGFSGTLTLGGRAGRTHNEVLVVNGSMTGNSTQNTVAFPSS